MPTTPAHLGTKVDWAVDHLNSHWDLEIPKLHGIPARNAAGNDRLPFRCFSRIRMLTFRSIPIEDIIEEFDQKARAIHSKWVWKPSQEKGTLPLLTVSKSLIESEKRRSQVVNLTPSQRADLCQALFEFLDEYCKLAQLSESMSTERLSDTTYSTAPSTPSRRKDSTRTQGTLSTPRRDILREGQEPRLKNPGSSVKRSIPSPDSKSKRQQTLKQLDYFRPPPFVVKSEPLLPSNNRSLQEPTSFETTSTSRVSSIFDDCDEQKSDISHQTSLIEGLEELADPEKSQDLFPTQELEELLEDEDFRRSFHESSCLPNDIDAALSNTFPERRKLPSHVPFWLSWEIHRLADKADVLPFDLYNFVRRRCKTDLPTFEAYWEAAREYSKHNQVSTPPRSEIPSWMATENKYIDLNSARAIYLTANLAWRKDFPDGVFKLETNEIRLEQSCRLYRKFGADRFLVLTTPEFSQSSYPEALKARDSNADPMRQRITDFLTRKSHFIAGRYWRVFYVEPEKNKRRKDQPSRLKFFLFAESGYDMESSLSTIDPYSDLLNASARHQEIGIEVMAEWHLRFGANAKSKDLKLFSRWGLGLSKTTPTIVLDRKEFVVRHDPPSAPIMDDGCALISLQLAQAIWEKCGGQGDVPCAVQGRISGAKGLWIVDFHNRHPGISDREYWIEVSDSQLKIKPHPRRRKRDDADLRTFEVLKWASECKPGHLNIQLITVLEDGGVPRQALENALVADTLSFSESLTAAVKDKGDGRLLYLWMRSNGLLSPSEAQKVLGTFPYDCRQQLTLLLESSFNASESAKIKKCVKTLLTNYMANYVERLWITQTSSTTVFCVPDPTGKLKNDEVCLNFSRAIQDPRNGMSELVLNDIDVLVARNPAYLASDIQKRKAVYIHELRHYRNVIVFPTTGTRALASMLSGGDYDGDTCWVCWDPAMVEHFHNSDLPALPDQGRCGMKQESRPLREIFTKDRPIEEAMQDFSQTCMRFNARPSLMGICSSEHEKLIYSLSQRQKEQKLSHPGAIKLAALASYLVDSSKQGWSLSETSWFSLRADASGRKQLPIPAYKEGKAPRRQGGEFPNVVDFLMFEVAEREKDRTLAKFQKLNPGAGVYDGVLSVTWKEMWEDALEEKKVWEKKTGHGSRGVNSYAKSRVPVNEQEPARGLGIYLICDNLKQRIAEVQQRWKEVAPAEDSSDQAKYNYAVRQIHELFLAIEPKQIDHVIRRQYEKEKTRHFSSWSLLRASCLHYTVCQRGSFPEWVWYIAGRELCHLKAMSHGGPVRLVAEDILDIMKVGSKFAKALVERQSMDDEEIDGEELVDDVDDG
ncbi:hypothetical protein PV08_02539 [Exophiala spinifera]|uniref:RNA-dependent RNA polymerase n=1 Tax=Exophiala spinifera TaxID=91928 RepID=A0A0D1YSL0_9EURO|nr:uncharacterized protein PV08_02539 [Exophiala spinifera]KIW18251.1 hypothetical protein PV08_02539 [Exophiala spinifera]